MKRVRARGRGTVVLVALIAVIAGGLLVYSPRLLTRTAADPPAWSAVDWVSPADGSPQLVRATWLDGWVGISIDGVWRSTDGFNWRKLGAVDGLEIDTPNQSGFGRSAAGVVVSGQDGDGWFSQDGEHWEPAQMSAELADWRIIDLDCGGAGCLGSALRNGSDTGGMLAYSKDGRVWSLLDIGYFGLSGSAVAIGPRTFVLGGDDPNTGVASASWSENGSTWTQASYDGTRARRGSFTRGFVTAHGFALVETADETEVCSGDCVTTTTMWTSTDGHRLGRLASPPPNGDIVSDGYHLVASRVINTSTTYRVELLQSFDGATWEPLQSAVPAGLQDFRLLALGPDSLLVADRYGAAALGMSPAVAGTPTRTLAPGPTARGDLVATTVAVTKCDIPGWPRADAAVPATMVVRIPPSLVGKLEVRSHPSGRAFVLAPIGWDCSGLPESSVWVINASSGEDWIHFEFVTQGDYAADVGCPAFPEARQYSSSHCDTSNASEIRRITPELATYWRQDGTRRYREAVWFRHSGYGSDMAAEISCDAASTRIDICDAEVEFFADTIRLLPGFNP